MKIHSKILVADSGSTKTEWAYADGDVVRIAKTEGINPVFMNSDEICERVMKACAQLGNDFDKVFFYGAGCIGSERCLHISEAIARVMPHADVEVQTDLMGAARALCGQSEGIACILGTGANSCLYDGHQIQLNTPPLGFILGDEGSGANIGKAIVADCLKGLMPSSITEAMYAYCGLSYSEIIDRVYRQPAPNRFLASFALFAKQNIGNARVEQTVKECFQRFIDRNLRAYGLREATEINFVGSVAYGFADLLGQTLIENGLTLGKVLQHPIEELVKFHNEK